MPRPHGTFPFESAARQSLAQFAKDTGSRVDSARVSVPKFGRSASSKASVRARKAGKQVYSSLNLEPKPATIHSVLSVKAFECETLDETGQKQLKNAHKRLLVTASKQPLGVEAGRAYDLNMKPLTKELTGAAERSTVSVPKQNVPYIVIHTHPDSNIFSQRDLSNFANKEISYQEAAESLNFLVRNCLSELEGYGVKFYE